MFFGVSTVFGDESGCSDACLRECIFWHVDTPKGQAVVLGYRLQNTLETTLETAKARKNAKIGRQNFGPPTSDEYVASDILA